MGTDENRELVRRYFETVWTDGRWDRVHEFVGEDFVNHGSLPGHPTTSIEDARRLDEMGHRAFPDLRWQLVHVVADGEWVARHWAADGTHEGEFMGVPATGRRVHFEGMVFGRIEGGRIVEEWRVIDSAGLMQQLTEPDA